MSWSGIFSRGLSCRLGAFQIGGVSKCCRGYAVRIRHFSQPATVRSDHVRLDRKSIDAEEVKRFASVASQWWDPHGYFGKLQQLNLARLSFIRQVVEKSNDIVPKTPLPFTGLKVLDVGCGGGLLSEPLARLGAEVTGIDATAESITAAREHAKLDRAIVDRIQYEHCTLEDVIHAGKEFDVVIASEVIEHVASPTEFVSECSTALCQNGTLILSTINRTAASQFFAVFLAENVLGWVPQGTHNHDKFITPSELDRMMEQAGLQATSLRGMKYSPLRDRWFLDDDTEINYITAAEKVQD